MLPLLFLWLNVASAAAAEPFYAQHFSKQPTVAEMTELGRRLFFDRSLSASGKISCGTCHDPRFGYGPSTARPVELGGRDVVLAGIRAVPSLRYLQSTPPFSEHFEDEELGGADQGPTGGHTWDGRADTVHDQARLPLLSPLEMANASPGGVVDAVERGVNAAAFRETFGDDAFANRERAFNGILLALEVFQQSPRDFYPYSSRYDAWLRGKADLGAREKRGLALFEDPKKGNCASCHPSRIRGGALPAFTDFGFVALGVPRNPAIPANRDPKWWDLGLCGPLRTDFASRADYCGLFRAPTLRNVAVRRSFFHNGVFHDLRRAVEFYAEKDRHPDLPVRYRANLSRDLPVHLTASEIDDVLSFLDTLTDADLLGDGTETRSVSTRQR